jgi:hypothetical protein
VDVRDLLVQFSARYDDAVIAVALPHRRTPKPEADTSDATRRRFQGTLAAGLPRPWLRRPQCYTGTVEAWGRSPDNPISGWYGLKKGLRGRFGVYIPPLMEELGLVELEHNPKGNRMRAK